MQIHKDAVEFCDKISSRPSTTINNKKHILISPIATLIASLPSATTTHRHPNLESKVSIIFAVMGLSSANRQVTDRSFGSGHLFKSTLATDDGGVLAPVSPYCVDVDALPIDIDDGGHTDISDSPMLEDTDAVLSLLGIEFRLFPSASI